MSKKTGKLVSAAGVVHSPDGNRHEAVINLLLNVEIAVSGQIQLGRSWGPREGALYSKIPCHGCDYRRSRVYDPGDYRGRRDGRGHERASSEVGRHIIAVV